MRDIYRSARDVAICLSTKGVGSSAIEWLLQLGAEAEVPELYEVIEVVSRVTAYGVQVTRRDRTCSLQ
jgi:hypothetical protein